MAVIMQELFQKEH